MYTVFNMLKRRKTQFSFQRCEPGEQAVAFMNCFVIHYWNTINYDNFQAF